MNMLVHSRQITEGVSRIDRILNQPEMETISGGKMPETNDISFEHVSFSYNGDDINAVDDVSFTLKRGSITGLVGPSGGGKSTVAQLLLRFYAPQAGSIKIGGMDIRQISAERMTSLVSYVFQDSFLFHDTIENIRMGNTFAIHEQVILAAKNANIHEVILALPQGYHTIVGEEDVYLSGGEQQRIPMQPCW